jgi:hypothetical protein
MSKLSSEEVQRLIDDALKGASNAKPAAGRNGKTNGRAASIDNDSSEPNEIDRLARLPTIEYDRQRMVPTRTPRRFAASSRGRFDPSKRRNADGGGTI